MKIRLITVGKIKEPYLRKGIAFYEKELKKKIPFEMIEVEDEKTPDHASEKVENKIKEVEGDRILRYIPEDAHVVALAIDGMALSTEQFTKKIKQVEQAGCPMMVFVIGGSLGLTSAVLKRAQTKISFSVMTFPHQMMKMILLEQLNRVLG